MATCYRCGAPNADYRRNTFVGSSTGNWWSKRSYGSSSRTYYGLKSVCGRCAKSIDSWNTIKLFFWIVAIIVTIYYFSNRNTSSVLYNDNIARVVPTKGVNLRGNANTSSAVLLSIPFDEKVEIIDKTGPSETFSGHTAKWFKVSYHGTEGWLWSGYLETTK